MAFEQRDNSGALFKRSEEELRGKSPNASQYSGKVMIEGRQYYIDAWVKDGAKGKFFSLAFKPVQAQQSAPPQRDWGPPRKDGQSQGKHVPQKGVLDEEIPFSPNTL